MQVLAPGLQCSLSHISGRGLCYQARCILIGPSKTRGLTCAHLGYVLQTFALHKLLELLQMKQECTSSFSSQCRLQHDYIAQTAASTDASRRDPQARFSKIFVVHTWRPRPQKARHPGSLDNSSHKQDFVDIDPRARCPGPL